MEVIVKIFFGVAVIAGILMLTRDVLVPAAKKAPATASVLDALPATEGIKARGTLTYQLNNAGVPVPYLVYKTDTGSTAAKTLVFNDTSSCSTDRGKYPCPLIADALSTYYGPEPIEVNGTLDKEHITVDSISPIAPAVQP